ncbi:DegT/DnrJ/EryC1/StrS aminotransferase [Chlorobium ferrooxidans DSM 13031]|uniref:DegT/DnrJ/EryC1/StrS aminotransferase n=1 Tax=Chlorobium ferrooxidans DSM 13031 TaxID=377431 RepID=Q0YTS9_9CHLB|nr:DegT/DnrJ/EryC1/StrS aminotransferase [Chlorobium ferrooxidans DSM 13031]
MCCYQSALPAIVKTETVQLEHQVAELTSRGEAVALGRAAFGLFALLSLWKIANAPQKIALPSFLCQSPLAAVLHAGWEPVFCDIDVETGNVSDSEWQRVFDAGVDAVLFVHLFGNVGNAASVADLCRKKGIYFIEDAAQSFGGTLQNKPCGSFGDASLISFGHTKIIDVKHGGMVLTDDGSLADQIRKFTDTYSGFTSDSASVAAKFLEMFYAARNQLGIKPEGAREAFGGLMSIYKPLVLSRWNPAAAEEISAQLTRLESAAEQRNEKSLEYMDLLSDTALVPLRMTAGSVPWRAVFRLPGIDWAEQKALSDAVRLESIDISNWYIPSHWMMARDGSSTAQLGFTESLSQEIFQLWVDDRTSMDRVKKSASVFISKLDKAGYG